MPEAHKIAHFLGILTGRALLWAAAVWERGGGTLALLEEFVAHFRHAFDHSRDGTGTHEHQAGRA